MSVAHLCASYAFMGCQDTPPPFLLGELNPEPVSALGSPALASLPASCPRKSQEGQAMRPRPDRALHAERWVSTIPTGYY